MLDRYRGFTFCLHPLGNVEKNLHTTIQERHTTGLLLKQRAATQPAPIFNAAELLLVLEQDDTFTFGCTSSGTERTFTNPHPR